VYRMLTQFGLAEGASIEEFTRSLNELVEQLQSLDLVDSCTGPGKRDRHPIMDTDESRPQAYFFVMTFVSRAPCDAAVTCMQKNHEPAASMHRQTYALVCDPVFSCWEDA